MSHRGDPATSRGAALDNYPRSGTQKRRVLDELYRRGSRGATYPELQQALGIGSAQQRLSDLKKDGWVEPNGLERRTPRGSMADVYVVTQKFLEFRL